MTLLMFASTDDVRSVTEKGAADLTDSQAARLLMILIDLGYTYFCGIPSPVWQRYISSVKHA